MTGPNQTRRRPSSLDVGRAERAFVQLAALLAVLAGFVDAVGFLAFGHVFLASPDVDATVIGANLPRGISLPLFAGAMVLSFLGGVVLMTLATSRIAQFRRTVVLLAITLTLITSYAAFNSGIAYGPAVLLAMAMGAVHCVFERDNPQLQEAMSSSAQIARLGEALAGGRAGANPRQIGLHASFWLAFLFGGLAGAGIWMALDGWSLALAATLAALLTIRTWLVERDLLPA